MSPSGCSTPRSSKRASACSTASAPLVVPRFAPLAARRSIKPWTAVTSSRARHRGTHHRRDQRRRQHLVQPADGSEHGVRKVHHVAARSGLTTGQGHRRAECDEGARLIADGRADHLGELARERPLPPLGDLRRQDPVLEHQVVRDGHRHDVQHRHFCQHDGVEQARSWPSSARRCSCARLPGRRTGRATASSSATNAFSVTR